VCIDGISVDPTIPVTIGSDLRVLEIGGYRGSRLWAGSVAHVALYAGSNMSSILRQHWDAGATGYSGETADLRIYRLCKYANLLDAIIQGSTHA
ncbi:hypothetical protein ACWGOK_41265, partial [Streptomyces eurythermus]